MLRLRLNSQQQSGSSYGGAYLTVFFGLIRKEIAVAQQQNTSTGGRADRRGSNLDQDDRQRGGESSANQQDRDNQGQFAGNSGSSSAQGSETRGSRGTYNPDDRDQSNRREEGTWDEGASANAQAQRGMEDADAEQREESGQFTGQNQGDQQGAQKQTNT